jgi:hypothetical protein
MVALTSACLAEETLREINWPDMSRQGKLNVGEIVEPDADCPFTQLRVQNLKSEKKTFAVLTISDPCITAASYAVTGQVRYEDVEATGYLEMWNHFPDGSMYFSRTLNDSGPMQSLSGSSGWRSFTLPFYINGNSKVRPTKLEFNVVLPGQGTVYLGPLKLSQFEKGELVIDGNEGDANAWWGNRTAGLVGGVTGSVIGLLGAVIGILTGVGIARKLCLLLLGAMFLFGVVSLGIGLAALAFSQPYAVYYPLLLLGFLCTVLPLVLFGSIKRQYEQKELRKMQAMDVSSKRTSK